MRTRFKKILLIAPDAFPEQLLTDYTHLKHISAVTSIFPSINEFNPDLIVFDYDLIPKEMETILRRIRVNKFYNKVKIYCYKNKSNEKTDSLLKVLGVDRFIYREDLVKKPKNKTIFHSVHSVFDTSVARWVTNVTH